MAGVVGALTGCACGTTGNATATDVLALVWRGVRFVGNDARSFKVLASGQRRDLGLSSGEGVVAVPPGAESPRVGQQVCMLY